MRPEKDGPTQRHERLGHVLLDELGSLFRDDVEDPTLYGIRIAVVVLSVDYRHLRVHYTCQGPTPARALERVTPFLRARLADAVDLKRVPELSFIRDV